MRAPADPVQGRLMSTPVRSPQEMLQKIQGTLDELERTRSWITSIEQVTETLGTSTSLHHSLEELLRSALEMTHTTIGALALREEPGQPVQILGRREGDESLLDRARSELEGRHFMWVIEHSRPLLLSPPGVPSELEDVRTEHFHAGNFLLIPFAPGLETGGVLSVGTLERRHRFSPEDHRFLRLLATMATGTLRSMRAVEEVQHFLIATIRSLCAALDARDPYTRGHSERVAMYSMAIMNELEGIRPEGFPEGFRDSVRLGAMLHDVGKIGIPDEILHKPDRLTPAEFDEMKTHTTKGAAIVSGVKNTREIVYAVKYHHERLDGSGYPEGLKGEAIPYIAQIVGIADTFDAMTSDRPYRAGCPHDEAVKEIVSLTARHYHPDITLAIQRAFDHGTLSQTFDSELDSGMQDRDEMVSKLFDTEIRELPSMPQVVHKVIEKSRNPNCSVKELSELVARDQGLVSRILRLVNSAFYGFSRRISTINLAITILGLRNVRNLVINVGLAGFFRGGGSESRETRLRLWEHSVETAVGAMTLARMRKMSEPDEAFTAGLLHDIGRIALDYQHHDLSARIENLVSEEGLSPGLAEEKVIGVDHGAIGAWVAAQWNLPRMLCDAIRFHHDPARCALEAPQSLPLTYVVSAAEALSDLRHSVEDNMESHLWHPAVVHLALTPEETREVLDAMEREKEAMLHVLGREP